MYVFEGHKTSGGKREHLYLKVMNRVKRAEMERSRRRSDGKVVVGQGEEKRARDKKVTRGGVSSRSWQVRGENERVSVSEGEISKQGGTLR